MGGVGIAQQQHLLNAAVKHALLLPATPLSNIRTLDRCPALADTILDILFLLSARSPLPGVGWPELKSKGQLLRLSGKQRGRYRRAPAGVEAAPWGRRQLGV